MASAKTERSTLPKRILLGFDELGLADAALEAAVHLSAKLSARLELFHAVPPLPVAWPGLDPLSSAERNKELLAGVYKAAHEHIHRTLAKAKPSAFDESQLRVVEGKPGDVLIQAARSEPRAMIVLGARRQAGLVHFGGTRRRVIAAARGPVWIQNRAFGPIARILAPVDFSAPSERSFELAIALATSLGARVRAMHVIEAMRGYHPVWSEALPAQAWPSATELRAELGDKLAAFMKRFAGKTLDPEPIVEEGYAAQHILQRAGEHDLVVLGSHGSGGAMGGLRDAFLGSTSWSVVLSSTQPVVLLPDERAPGGL
jgi:nucleotide-binding universal stress UspA family protein